MIFRCSGNSLKFCWFLCPLWVPRRPFWVHLKVLGDHFGDQVGHRCTQGDPGGCQNGFLTIFDGLWVTHWRPVWVTFWYVLWFGVSKSMFGLQAWFLMVFDWKISWFVMSQPLKNILNIVVFIGFHVFVVLVILMISGTCLDLIFETFGGLGRPFKWFFGVLDMHWNFVDFQDHPELRTWTWWKVNCLSKAYSNRS